MRRAHAPMCGFHIGAALRFGSAEIVHGCNVEFDADMDTHDDDWAPREAPMGPEAAQAFVFQYREKWAPGPGPKPGA